MDLLLSIARLHGVHVPNDRDVFSCQPVSPGGLRGDTPIGDERYHPSDQRQRVSSTAATGRLSNPLARKPPFDRAVYPLPSDGVLAFRPRRAPPRTAEILLASRPRHPAGRTRGAPRPHVRHRRRVSPSRGRKYRHGCVVVTAYCLSRTAPHRATRRESPVRARETEIQGYLIQVVQGIPERARLCKRSIIRRSYCCEDKEPVAHKRRYEHNYVFFIVSIRFRLSELDLLLCSMRKAIFCLRVV